jgi:hypothetical protein
MSGKLMTLPVAEDTTKYVDQKSLDVLLQTLVDRIQESDDVNRQRIGDLEKAFNQSVQQVKSDSLATMQQVMDERFAKEKAERRSEIDSLAGELRAFAKDINTNIGEMQRGVSHITGLMESLPKQLQTRDEKDVETHKAINARIDYQAERLTQHNATLSQVQSDIDNIEASQGSTSSEVKRIRATIHGDPENKDDAPSLFKMMEGLKVQMTSGFMDTSNRLDFVVTETAKNSTEIATIKQERTLEKAQWAQRWHDMKSTAKELLKTRWAQLAIGALVGGFVLSGFPELREQFVNQLIEILQGGS